MNEIPKMVAPRAVEAEYAGSDRAVTSNRLLDQVIAATGRGGFDADAWHVMDRRDNALIADEIANGATSGKFVYAFKMKDGSEVSGVSVVGARHLAYEYGGIRSYLVSSVQKVGSLWLFRSYPHSGRFDVRPEHFRDLEDEPDFYEVLIEVQDMKTGNSIQVEKRETHFDTGKNGRYEKVHYITVAQSKAFRNGLLSLLPQDVILKFKLKNLALAAKKIDIGEDVLAEKRSGVLRFAAAKAIPIDRTAVEALTLDQIGGLSDAAHAGSAPAFAHSAQALGLVRAAEDRPPAAADVPKRGPGRPRKSEPPFRQDAGAATAEPRDEPPHDPETGEIAPNEPAPSESAPQPFGFEFG